MIRNENWLQGREKYYEELVDELLEDTNFLEYQYYSMRKYGRSDGRILKKYVSSLYQKNFKELGVRRVAEQVASHILKEKIKSGEIR